MIPHIPKNEFSDQQWNVWSYAIITVIFNVSMRILLVLEPEKKHIKHPCDAYSACIFIVDGVHNNDNAWYGPIHSNTEDKPKTTKLKDQQIIR